MSKQYFSGKPLKNVISKNIPSKELAEYSMNRGIRESLGLPLTKQLVYYPAPYTEYEPPYHVKEFAAQQYLTEEGVVTDWSVCKLVLESGKTIEINSGFFASMQNPNFVQIQKEMRKKHED